MGAKNVNQLGPFFGPLYRGRISGDRKSLTQGKKRSPSLDLPSYIGFDVKERGGGLGISVDPLDEKSPLLCVFSFFIPPKYIEFQV
jgi:hypothetical protein